jgi:hypothetical protein
MNKTARRIRFRSRFEVGTGTQVPSGTVVPLIATIEYERHDPTMLDIELLLLADEQEQGAAIVSLQRPFHSDLWLHNDAPGVPSVEILGIHRISGDGAHVSIGAFEIRAGITDAPQESETTWIVKAELTPSGILQVPGIRHLRPTGDVDFEPLQPGSIEVATGLGTLQAGERYAYYDSEEHGNKVMHSVQRAAITGSIRVPKGESLASVNQALLEEVEAICTVLSFCYRQPVDFYEIWYATDPETTPRPDRREATLRRRMNSTDKRIGNNELIHHNNLVGGGLDQLVNNYKKSKHKNEVTRAISFLAASYKVEPVESAYFLAYSALDLITSTGTAGEVYLLAASKWKKVQKLLRGYLDSIADKEGITDVVEKLKEKLAELRRVSGDRRIMEACRTLGVKTDNLWRTAGFEAGLKSATMTRNRLFHAAGDGVIDDIYVDLIRVRTLVERLLLAILEWPDERTWVWKHQELARIRD